MMLATTSNNFNSWCSMHKLQNVPLHNCCIEVTDLCALLVDFLSPFSGEQIATEGT